MIRRILGSGFLSRLRRHAHASTKILLYDDRNLLNHAGGMLVPIGAGIDLGLMMPDQQDTYRRRFVGCVSGASMLMPRSVFIQLGGFDSDFFAYFEDVDLCWRAWLAGYQVAFRPSSRVYHKLSATAGPLLKPERLFLGERNRLQCMVKNLEMRNLIAAVFVSCLYTVYRLLGFLRSRKPAAAVAVLRGDWWVLTHLPGIVMKRRRVQQSRRISDAFLTAHSGYENLTIPLPLFFVMVLGPGGRRLFWAQCPSHSVAASTTDPLVLGARRGDCRSWTQDPKTNMREEDE
jgi:GT2 family glycosyltransferase